MRLIDADSLKGILADRLEKICARFGVDSSGAGAMAGAMALLDAQPTVDAVPVSFIRDLINLARKAGADSHAESLEALLADWAETRQVPKANISPCNGCEDYIYGGGCKRNGECVAR